MPSIRVSVVIVTKNRAASLLRCLSSLLAQSVDPDEIVIVDNNSVDSTKSAVERFRKHVTLPIRLIEEPGHGYPAIYNRGLRESRYPWTAFVDDDCVVDTIWLERAKNTISEHSETAVVLGNTLPGNPGNIYSLTTYLFQADWKQKNLKNDEITNYEILDNKNIVYNNKFLKKKNLSYDELRTTHLSGAAEDCDLGRQIEFAGGRAVYNKTMIACHDDPTTFSRYWKKFFFSLASYKMFRQKWHQDARPAHMEKHNFRRLAAQISEQYGYHGTGKILFYMLVYTTVGISMAIEILSRLPSFDAFFIKTVDSFSHT